VVEAFYDSNVLIAYLFEEEGKFEVAHRILKKYKLRAISVIAIHEIHMYSLKYNTENKFLQIKDILDRIFKIMPLTQEACIRASYLRIEYNLPEVDSLILATAVKAKYRNFYTFDKDFEQLDGKEIEETTIHYIKI